MSAPIPAPPGLPILGNILDVSPSNTWGSLNALAEKYGPIFKINVLGHQIVFVANNAYIEEICDQTRFRKCVTGPVVEIRAAVHDSLFTAFHSEDDSWGKAHRIMAPLVSPEAVREEFAGMRDTAKDLVQKWSSTHHQKVSVTNDLDRLNHAANMLCFFDQRVDCVLGDEPAVIKAQEAATGEAMRRPTRPRLFNWLYYNRKFDNHIKVMRDYGAKIVATRKETQNPKKDMLCAMLHGKDPQSGNSLTDSQVLDEIINIFIGSATAPNLVSFALYYLVKNPEEIKKAQEEIDAVVGTGEWEYEHLAKLPYCEAILREAFRLSAVAPGFNIEPIPDTQGPVTLGDGKYEIPTNQPIIAILSQVNRDPDVFEDPNAFKPERMVGEKYDRLPSGVKKGFGNGKRECIGKKYAYDWSLLALVAILRDIDIEEADASYKVANAGVNYNGAFSVKPLGFHALVSPRKR